MDLETSIDIKDEPLLDDGDMVEDQDGENASKNDVENLNVEDLPEDYFADLIGLNVLDEWVAGEEEEEEQVNANKQELIISPESDKKKSSESVTQSASKRNRSPDTEALSVEKRVKTTATANTSNTAAVFKDNQVNSQPQLLKNVKTEPKSPVNDDDEDTVPFDSGLMPVSGDNAKSTENTANNVSNFDISSCLRRELSKSDVKSASLPVKTDTAASSTILSKASSSQVASKQQIEKPVEKNKLLMEKQTSSKNDKQVAEKSTDNTRRLELKERTKSKEKKSLERKSSTESKLSERKSSTETKLSERKSSTETKLSKRKSSTETKLSKRKSSTETKLSEQKSSLENKSSERKVSIDKSAEQKRTEKSSEQKRTEKSSEQKRIEKSSGQKQTEKSSERKSATENKSERKSLTEIKVSHDNNLKPDAGDKRKESSKHRKSKLSKSPERKPTPVSVPIDKQNQPKPTGLQPLMGINLKELSMQQERPSSPNCRSPRYSYSPERKYRSRRSPSPMHRRSRSPSPRRRRSRSPLRMSPSRRRRRSISPSPDRRYSRSPRRSRSITRRSRSPHRRSSSEERFLARLDSRRKRQQRSRSGSPMSISTSPSPKRRSSPLYSIRKRSRSPRDRDDWDYVKEAALNQTANNRTTMHTYESSTYPDITVQTQPPNLVAPNQPQIQPFYNMNMPQQQLPVGPDPMNFQQGSYYPQPGGYHFAGPSFQSNVPSYEPHLQNFQPDVKTYFQPDGLSFPLQPVNMNYMMNMPPQQPMVLNQSYPVPQPVPPPTEMVPAPPLPAPVPAPPLPAPELVPPLPPSLQLSKNILEPVTQGLRVVSLDKMKNNYNPDIQESSSSDSDDDDEYEVAGIPTDVRLSSFLEATLDATKKAPIKPHIVSNVDKMLNILDADISLMQPVSFVVKRSRIIDPVPRNSLCRSKTNPSLLAKAAIVDAALTPSISKVNIRAIRIPENPKFVPQKRLRVKDQKPLVETASIGTMTDNIPTPPPPSCLACAVRNEKTLMNRWTQTLGVSKHSIYVQVGRSLELTHDPAVFRNNSRSARSTRELILLEEEDDEDICVNVFPRTALSRPPVAPSPPKLAEDEPPHDSRYSPPVEFGNHRMHHRREVETSRGYNVPRYRDVDRPVEDTLHDVSGPSRGNIRSRLVPPDGQYRFGKRV